MNQTQKRQQTETHARLRAQRSTGTQVQEVPQAEMQRVEGGSRHAVFNDGYLYFGYYDVMIIED